MSWPKGKPNPWASERMKRWHQEQQRGREEKPKKPSRSLSFLTPEERREYEKLRRYGCGRDEAIAAVLKDVAA